ncbi:MAG TPA: hypothetical protein IAA79_06440 [Candidatus Avirikenella pullistercoris]|nr:hypothetical protein [Candidatus Avirikenella pullistercoris]
MKCVICQKNIVGPYYTDYWENHVCAGHYETGEVQMCSSCGALTLKSEQMQLSDGRHLCNSCVQQVISRPDQVAKIKKLVLSRLIDEGVRFQDRHLDSVPIDIMSAREISELRGHPLSIKNKGVTRTRRVTSFGGKLFGMKPKMLHHIYILDYLIKIEFAGTLAHEIMHVWQNENQIKLAPPQSEGLCNLGAWLAFTTISSVKAPYFMKLLQENPDPVYGDGFRYVHSLFEKYGWEELLRMAKNRKL